VVGLSSPVGLNSTDELFKKVRNKKSLWTAWQKVFVNGITSLSRQTKNEIKEFQKVEHSEIERLYRALLKDRFRFSQPLGVPLKSPGKEPRPIVKADIRNRIVQRAILDVLQAESAIKPFLEVPSSFGGIQGRNVKDAVGVAYNEVMNGAAFFIRSDIEKFFAHIPREKVLQFIFQLITGERFCSLLADATLTELSNLAELGEYCHLFPTYEIGVAQGCCLSPLLGNILLYDFDVKMNKSFVCIRYIDDFIIFGKTRNEVKAGFTKAQRMLKELGLRAYNPFSEDEKKKADIGPTYEGFTFLGCEILPGLVRPSKKSRRRLLSKVEEQLTESAGLFASPETVFRRGLSFAQTLSDVSNTIMGWGNQYSYCNDRELMKNLDAQIQSRLYKYFAKFKNSIRETGSDTLNFRRLFGVQALVDCKQDPIFKKYPRKARGVTDPPF
jgi:RNA-directed DNA polymerase